MKAKGIFISTLAAINAYLGGFAYGFNAHPVLVIDPKLPPVVQNKSEPVKTAPPAAVAKPGAASEKAKPAKGRHEVSKSNAVKAGNSGNSGKSGNSGNSGNSGKSEKAPSKSGAKNGAAKSNAAKSNAAKNNAAKNVGASSPERQKPH